MDKQTLQQRIEDLKKENDSANQQINQLESQKQNIIREALVRNGRILELMELLKGENA